MSANNYSQILAARQGLNASLISIADFLLVWVYISGHLFLLQSGVKQEIQFKNLNTFSLAKGRDGEADNLEPRKVDHLRTHRLTSASHKTDKRNTVYLA